MSGLGSVREGGRTDVRGKTKENGDGGRPFGFHSVVIRSSCFHTGGNLRLSSPLSGISPQLPRVAQLMRGGEGKD